MARVVDPEGTQLAGIRRLVDFSDRRVLELGCGRGRLTFGYAGDARSVDASDPDGDEIAAARAALPDHLRERVAFRVAAAADVHVPPCSIDLVFFSWSL
jgi:predicted RNA methylase